MSIHKIIFCNNLSLGLVAFFLFQSAQALASDASRGDNHEGQLGKERFASEQSLPADQGGASAVALQFAPKSAEEIRAILPNVTIPDKMFDNPSNSPDLGSDVLVPIYSVALADLDSDGKPEVFVQTGGSGWCGSSGCPLDLYKIFKTNTFVKIQSWTVENNILLLSSKHRNFYDLAFALHWPENNKTHRIWRWNNVAYECFNCSNKNLKKQGIL